MVGYGREGAAEAHYVGDVILRQALCGVSLPSIPLHQMTPARVCSACRSAAAHTPPLPAHDVEDVETAP